MKEHLKRVAKVFTGTTPPTNISRYYNTEDVLWFSPGDIPSDGIEPSEPRRISKSFFDECGINYYPAHSVLMVGIGATVGKVGYSDRPFYTNQQINTIVFDERKVLPKFGAYYLLNKSNEINKKTPIVTLQIFNQSKVKQVLIEYPSLSEQQRIVNYLDAKIAAIDERIGVLEKQQDAYARLKKSIIHQAVTRGLNPNVPLKDSGIEWIGMIPEHWEVKRFKSIFSECKSVTETGKEDLLSVSEYYGIARRIDKMEDGEYESRADSLIGYKICKKDDLVINIMLAWKRGLGFSDYDGIVSPAYAVYRGKNIVPHYFHYLMRTDMYVAEYKRNSKGIIDSRLRMYTDRFNNIIAIVPPLYEQQSIAAYLDEKCAKIDAATENIGKQIDASKRLKRALINEVITGQRAV